MAYITATSTTSSSITVKLAGLDTGYSGSARTVYWYINGTYKTSKSLSNGVSSGAAYTFTGLSAGTFYEIEADVYNSNGLLASFSESLATVVKITITASATRIQVTVSSPGDFTYFKISCMTQSGVEYGGSASYSTSRTKTFTGLPSNTWFNIFCSYSQNNYTQYGQVADSALTLVKPTLYEVTASKTSTSITVALSNYSDFRYFKYSIQLLDGTTVGGSGSYVTSASYTFTGLSPNTTYNVFCNYSNNSSSTVDDTLGITVTTAKISRPSNFEWTNAKVTGKAFNLTAAEWNSFTARINAFRAYKGLSNYSFTTAYTGNVFTAAMYTQAQTAIKGIAGYGTGIPNAVKGGAITADHFTKIRDELNSIP